MATNTQPRLTYRDYFDLPESDERYELIDGVLYMSPPPTPDHQGFLFVLTLALGNFVVERGLGRIYFSPIGVVLSDDDVLQPDLIFIATERLNIITGNYVLGAPDLVVEVLSPSTARRDRTVKREMYERSGVREYWLVDIGNRSIEVNAGSEVGFATVEVYGEGDVLASSLFPGFSMDISSAFESARI